MKNILLLFFLFPVLLPAQNMLEGTWTACCGLTHQSASSASACGICEWKILTESSATMLSFKISFTSDSVIVKQEIHGRRATTYSFDNASGNLTFAFGEESYKFKVSFIAGHSKQRSIVLVDDNGFVVLLEKKK